jgi:SAM-dependent methyltransferase
MAHPQQQAFCESVKKRFPQYFSGTMVLDIGSLDINGNNQVLFDADSLYLGIDVAAGRNVDIVCPAHELGLPAATFDTVVSTECLEHDMHWIQSLQNAIRMLRPGGLLLITCATTGRPEHGTRRTTPHDAPLLAKVNDEWADYYCNLDENDIRAKIDVAELFQFAEFSIGEETHDLYFFAIKHGVFERRLDRSTHIESHPAKLLASKLSLQAQQGLDALQHISASLGQQLDAGKAREQDLLEQLRSKMTELESERAREKAQEQSLSEQITSMEAERAREKAREQSLSSQITSMETNLQQVQTKHLILAAELSRVYNSKSWRTTHPLRVVMTQAEKIGSMTRRARNGLRYVARGDIGGLLNRLRSIKDAQVVQNFAISGPPKHWCIMATSHTLFVGHLLASRLRAHGWEVDIMTSAPSGFPHQMYIVVCPQMFDLLPPGEKRIVYQMEQSVSSRWFTAEYFNTLENSLAVLEYSLINVEFMADKGVAYPHVHYLPVGADATYMDSIPVHEKTYDVLFYGDANSSQRRRDMLAALRVHFNVRICSEVFGLDMIKEVSRARIVINLHYYENALLETPRIQECLSLGVSVVSEASQDQSDYPELSGVVTFFEQGNNEAMIDAVRKVLAQPVESQFIAQAVVLGTERFAFMFDRFLIAMNLLPASRLKDSELPLPHDASRIALSMPETIARRLIFKANRPQNCAVFDGVRMRPGWVGCGLSYSTLAHHALKHGIRRLTVLEDDVLLPDNFEEKMRIVEDYLDTRDEQWDVFAGLVACLHEDVKVLHVETFQGVQFVTIDKMTSMVCNIYSENALRLLVSWNPDHRDDQINTIDKYLERQASLRVVVALPFLVGHREEVHSTLWGFQNIRYNELIANSEQALQSMVLSYEMGQFK